MWLAACFLLASQASPVAAQFGDVGPNYVESDMQFFSPVELDFENQPRSKSTGLYFRYDKLSWAITGDRTVIGDNSLVVQSEQIFRDTPFSRGLAPPTYQIFNSIQDAPPETDFGWGERYEFGKFDGGSGWMVGILDGPRVVTSELYGFNNLEIPNTIPLNDPANDVNFQADGGFAIAGPDGAITGSANLSTSRNGFGAVHVNFATPAGFLLGFVDYSTNSPTNGQGPTVGGPGRQIIAQVIAGDEVTDITFTSGADGVPDDLNGDLFTFFVVFVDANANGMFDDGEEIGNGVDFGDLHTFNVRFDSFLVRNTTETQGIELMKTHDLGNRHKLKTRQNNSASIAWGVRYLRIRDNFFWEGKGDILGRTFAETKVQNSIVGPQIRGKWSTQRGRWNMALDGRFVFGYNFQNLNQVGAIGEDLNPGAVNSLIAAQPNAVASGRNDNDFSPLVEFRAESSYQITNSISARLGYTAMFIDNITRASQSVRWFLPDLGLLEGGQQDIFINGIDFGFDVVY